MATVPVIMKKMRVAAKAPAWLTLKSGYEIYAVVQLEFALI